MCNPRTLEMRAEDESFKIILVTLQVRGHHGVQETPTFKKKINEKINHLLGSLN